MIGNRGIIVISLITFPVKITTFSTLANPLSQQFNFQDTNEMFDIFKSS
jgi:hypothetical protein